MKKFYLKKNNFFKKFFIKLNRKLGYEIIDQNKLIIPTSNKSLNENLNVLNNTLHINSILIINCER